MYIGNASNFQIVFGSASSKIQIHNLLQCCSDNTFSNAPNLPLD